MSDEKPKGLADILAQLARDVEKPEAAGTAQSESDIDVSEPRPRGLADLIADPMSRPFGWQTEAPDGIFTKGDPIGGSADLDRILALPRRTPFSDLTDETKEAVVEIEMQKHARYNENCACKQIDPRKPCLKRLNHAQAWMLREIGIAQGLLAHASTGIGKSLVDILAAMALTNVRTVLLLIPASLRQQIQYDYLMVAEHFHVPNIRLHYGDERAVVKLPAWDASKPTLHVLPYSRLSLPEESDFIQRNNPDAIISDECDAIRSMGAARGRRIAKWYAGGDTPEEKRRRQSTKFLGWTGSLTDHSICEFNFLSLFALKDRSPLPLNPETVEQWASCLDATNNPAPPGELLRLCEPGEDVRHAFRRRLAETQGFVIANLPSIEVRDGQGTVDLVIKEREVPELPQKIVDALKSVREGRRPDYLIPESDGIYSEELSDAMAIARCAQEVSSGVLYYWKFPRGEPDSLIKEWKGRRKEYFSEVREQALLGVTHLDSAMLCEQAAMRFYGELDERDDRPKWQCYSWPAWKEIRDKVEPQTASMVIDDFLARDALLWAEDGPGIIWYGMRALAAKMAELSGLPIHDGGPKGEQKLRAEDGNRSIICSIQSNSRGRDGLQFIFDRQLVANPPASATGWEQLLARTFRRGQRTSVVRTDIYMHTPELKKAVAQAIRRSEYVRDILGAEQKLLAGLKDR